MALMNYAARVVMVIREAVVGGILDNHDIILAQLRDLLTIPSSIFTYDFEGFHRPKICSNARWP